MKIMKSVFDRDKILFALPIILFSTFTILFYGPLGMYLSNTEEFAFTLKPVVAITGCTFLAAMGLLLVLMLLLPKGLSKYFHQLMFGVAFAMYLQAATNISYGSGVLDGSEIIWSDYTRYAVINTAMWAACILAPFVIGAIKWEKKNYVIPLLALFLTAIQIPAMVIQVVNYKPAHATEFTVTNRSLLDLGSESNFIMIVLDTMDEAYYEEFINANPEYKENLSGFVHYDNMLASGARTMMGMPSMLTGTPFKNETLFSEYVTKIWSEENPIKDIAESGVQVNIYSDDTYYSAVMADYVENYDSGEMSEDTINTEVLAKKLYKLDGFIYLPHLLKKYCWMDTAEFNQARDHSEVYYVSDGHFHKVLWNNDYKFRVNADTPKMFKLYHLMGAHEPYTLNKYGVVEKGATRQSQVEGVFYIVNAMLESLKKDGLYDSSTILITADHGGDDVFQHSFMMLKKPNATAPYSDSSVPASAFDITCLLYESYGLEIPASAKVYGRSLDSLSEDETRERHVFVNSRGEKAGFEVKEYVTDANLNEDYTWAEVVSYDNAALAEVPYEFGKELSFQSDASANVYCTEGVQGTTGWNSPFFGPYASMHLPLKSLPKKGTVNASFTLGHATYLTKDIRCQVYLNDVLAFDDVLTTDMAKKSFTANASAEEVFAGGENSLNIRWVFPEVDESEMSRPLLERTQTISLWNMCVTVK